MRQLPAWLRWPLRVYLAYVAVAFLVIMPLLNLLVPKTVENAVNRTFESELLFFNPFTIALDFRGLALEEPDSHRPIEVGRIEANLSLASLWQEGIVFDEVAIDELHLRVLRYADGRFHFDDLISDGSEESDKQDASSALPSLTVKRLAINARELTFIDRTRPEAYSTTQRDLNLVTKNISTKPNTSGDGAFELTSDGGGRLAWTGAIDIAGSASRGRLELSRVDLTHAWRYQKHELSVVLNSALLDATLLYDANWREELAFTLAESELRLHEFSAQPTHRHETGVGDLPSQISLGELVLSSVDFDLQQKTLAMGALRLSGLDADIYDRNGLLSVNDYLPQQHARPQASSGVAGEDDGSEAVDEQNPAPPGATNRATSTGTATNTDWNLRLQTLALNDSLVRWNTEYLSPGDIQLTPLEFSLEGLSYPAPSRASYSGKLVINEAANLIVSGELIPASGELSSDLMVDGLPLAWFNPLLNQATRTDIRSGTLYSEVGVQLGDFSPQEILIDLKINDFATELHETRATAFELAELNLSEMLIKPGDSSIDIASLQLVEPVGSLHVLEDGRLNVNGVIRDTDNNDQSSDGSASDAVNAPQKEPAKSEEPTSEQDTPPWGVRLGEFAIERGRLDFADDSLPLPFQANIAEISGRLTDLDTRAEAPLALELSGSVDGYAPVGIKAAGIYAQDKRDLQFSLDFNGVDIANMTPYSGTYAGYEIKSGTMNVNLRYGLQEEELAGNNRILIAQMELGERIESEKALNLPLKLALALLTDSQGVIDVSVPVSGSIDDPSFSLGGVIGRAITNLIVNAAAAPFKLLAGLVGSKQDLEDISFPAGRENLDQNASDSLDALAKALEQRPGLSIRVSGSYDPLSDTRSLKEASLKAELASAGFSESSIEQRDQSVQAYLLTKLNATDKLTGTDTNESVQPSPARAAATELSPPVTATSETPETVDMNAEDPLEPLTNRLWDRALATITLDDAVLQDLASARAISAKRFLVTEKALSPDRISISASLDQDFAGVHMQVAE